MKKTRIIPAEERVFAFSRTNREADVRKRTCVLDYVADFWYISRAKVRLAFFFRFSGVPSGLARQMFCDPMTGLPGMMRPHCRLPNTPQASGNQHIHHPPEITLAGR